MTRRLWVGALALALVAGGAFAQDAKKPAAPSAEEKAAMEAMMKAMSPGEAHKKLDAMVGTFNTAVKSYMAPGAPPSESGGVSVNTWVLGGRWLQQKFEGNFMGMPYSGIGYTGYDNLKKQYVGSWIDNMSTAMMTSTGSVDASGKSYEFSSTMDDPMSGKPMNVKEKVTVVDHNTHTLEMWGAAPDGKMFKMMEITYKRK
jgi:hypothetical protein